MEALWNRLIDLAADKVFYHYIIVRDDLQIGPMIAQTTHAAGESAALNHPPHGTHAVALKAPPDALESLSVRLSMADIAHVLYREIDPPWAGPTAIGIAPTHRTKPLMRILSGLKLVGGG